MAHALGSQRICAPMCMELFAMEKPQGRSFVDALRKVPKEFWTFLTALVGLLSYVAQHWLK